MSLTISITHQGQSHDVEIPTEWKDMTVDWWGGLTVVIKKHLDAAKLRKNALSEKSDPVKDDKPELDEYLHFDKKQLEIFQEMRLNRDIFMYLTNLDKEDMKLVDVSDVNKVINALGVLTEEYTPVGMKSFEFEEETYYFPSEFLKKETYGDFIEASQLDMYIDSMKHGKFDVLPQQMAILCRKIDEVYDDDTIEEKTEKFKKLPMDVIFEFGFFLSKQSINLAKLFNTYSAKKEKAKCN